MSGGALAGLTALAALLVLGAATASWATVTAPGDVVEGVRLPDEVAELSGAEEAPASVLAAVTGFLAVLPLALVGTADRLGGATGSRTPGTAARSAATLLGVGTAVLAGIALLGQLSLEAVGTDTLAVGPAPALVGIGALLVLTLTLLAWRIPRTTVVAEASRYTVEAVRGETTTATREGEEVDEWALLEAADAEDPTDPTDPAGTRPTPPDPEPRQ